MLRVGVSSCRSSPCAHRALISFSTCFPYRFPLCPACFPSSSTLRVCRRKVCYARLSDRERYEASEAALSGPETRNARENARRRCASSKHARLGCRYAPRPGCRAWGSGTIPSPATTRRSRLDLAARSLQPTQVRTGKLPGSGSSDRTVIPRNSLPCQQAQGTRPRHRTPGLPGAAGRPVRRPMRSRRCRRSGRRRRRA